MELDMQLIKLLLQGVVPHHLGQNGQLVVIKHLVPAMEAGTLLKVSGKFIIARELQTMFFFVEVLGTMGLARVCSRST